MTAGRVTAGVLLVALVAGMLMPQQVGMTVATVAYISLALLTAWAVRSTRLDPFSWLRRRSVRRLLVAVIVIDCVLLVTAAPATPSPQGEAPLIPLVLLLLLLNVALGAVTHRVATMPDSAVDEREEALRNRAHRIAYFLLALTVGGAIMIASTVSDATRSWLVHTAVGGGFFVFLELLFVLPAMVLAATAPAPLPDDADGRTRRNRDVAALLAVTTALPLLLALLLPAVPVQTDSWTQPANGPQVFAFGTESRTASSCRYFHVDAYVGRVEAATLRIDAVVCWNGRVATELWGLNGSDCLGGSAFAAWVTTVSCTRTTSTDGTLHYIYSASVESAVLPFMRHDVSLRLAVTRDGHELEFP